MDVTRHSDRQLVDAYADLVDGADPTSEDFDIDRASAIAAELEERGFVESDGVWTHQTKDDLTPGQ